MKKLNKVLFGFGSIAAVVAPVAAVVACGDSEKDEVKTISSAAEFKAFFNDQGAVFTDAQATKAFDDLKSNNNTIKLTKKYIKIDVAGVKQEKIFFLVEGTPTPKPGATFLGMNDQTSSNTRVWDIIGDINSSTASSNLTIDNLKHSAYVIAFEPENGTTEASSFKVATDNNKYGFDSSASTPLNR